MQKEKISVSWDDVNSPAVDAKLKEQDAKSREEFTPPVLSYSGAELKRQQRTSIWYNTVFAMSFFGCLGGLLAWGAGELIQLKPLTRSQYLAKYDKAQELYQNVQDFRTRHAAGITPADEFRRQIIATDEQAGEDQAVNQYYRILKNDGLSAEQKTAEIRKRHSTHDTTAFIARILSYGLCGMVIALLLSIAEPLIDRNTHGVMVNGAVGAMMGLFGGVIVSLFVDRLPAAQTNPTIGTLRPWDFLANAIKYAVVGLTLTIAPGIVMRNFKKLTVGLIGGLIGGVVGGLLLAPVEALTNLSVGKAVAFTAIGLLAGLATGLIENAAKTGWLKVVQGFITGKQFILYRATTYIGASPDCHIYLFKDPAIGRRHAAVHIVPGGFDLENLPLGSPTFVNGKPIARVRLRNGDQIQVGQTAFTFQEKAKATG